MVFFKKCRYLYIFRHALLDLEDHHSISNLGSLRWHLCLCLLLAWILVILFVSRGIKSTGKVAYFTATFPYVMLTVLVVRGVTLPGASEGIRFFLMPDWKQLANPDVSTDQHILLSAIR